MLAKPLFAEKQKFNQWYLWLLIVLAFVVPLIGFVQQVTLGKPFGEKLKTNASLILLILFSIAIITFFYMIQLKTIITNKTILFHFFPVLKHTFSFSEIETYKIINYGFVGGRGIRFTMKYGTVYNKKETKDGL